MCRLARCTTFLQTPNQLVSPHTRMSLQLENYWRENTHHYVRWSDDSRKVIRLYKPRLQQQLVLSPRCGHLKGNGGVKAVTADSNSISFRRLSRSAIDHRRRSTSTGQCAIGVVFSLGAGGTTVRVKRAYGAFSVIVTTG